MQLTTAMLADGAQVAQGKLYVLGGQWDRLMVASLPAQHASMAVVVVIRIEYNEAPKDCVLAVELTLDGKPMGVRAGGRLSIGHAAGLKHGAPQFAPATVTFANVQFERPGRYDWVVSVDDDVLGTVPLEVVQIPGLTARPGPAAENE
jgi:hypothetical protein